MFGGDEGEEQVRFIVVGHEDHVMLRVLAQLVGSSLSAVIDGVSYLPGLKVNDQYTARLRCRGSVPVVHAFWGLLHRTPSAAQTSVWLLAVITPFGPEVLVPA